MEKQEEPRVIEIRSTVLKISLMKCRTVVCEGKNKTEKVSVLLVISYFAQSILKLHRQV